MDICLDLGRVLFKVFTSFAVRLRLLVWTVFLTSDCVLHVNNQKIVQE